MRDLYLRSILQAMRSELLGVEHLCGLSIVKRRGRRRDVGGGAVGHRCGTIAMERLCGYRISLSDGIFVKDILAILVLRGRLAVGIVHGRGTTRRSLFYWVGVHAVYLW